MASRKKTYGTGTISNAGPSKWRIRIFMGYGASGKQIRPSKTITGTKTEAVRAMEALREETEEEMRRAANPMANMTVGEYAWQFFAEQKAVRPNAIAVKRDELTIRCIDKNFGDLLLTEVTPAHWRSLARLAGAVMCDQDEAWSEARYFSAAKVAELHGRKDEAPEPPSAERQEQVLAFARQAIEASLELADRMGAA